MLVVSSQQILTVCARMATSAGGRFTKQLVSCMKATCARLCAPVDEGAMSCPALSGLKTPESEEGKFFATDEPTVIFASDTRTHGIFLLLLLTYSGRCARSM